MVTMKQARKTVANRHLVSAAVYERDSEGAKVLKERAKRVRKPESSHGFRAWARTFYYQQPGLSPKLLRVTSL